MTRFLFAAMLAAWSGGVSRAARCTTVLDPPVLREYEDYVARAEQAMPARFDAGELAWLPATAPAEAAAQLGSGKLVRSNISDRALNQRLAAQNGTVIHWIGAVRIPGATVADVQSVLQDYDAYQRFYGPMVFACRAARNENAVYDVVMGLQNVYRFASLFPQHYAFLVKGRVEHSRADLPTPTVRVHLRAGEIRESASGVPGRDDLLEPHRDHGIMWALNAWWRARRQGDGLYLEFETITLARSVQAFACKIGFVPVPKSIIAAAMDSLPGDSVTVILEGTRAECQRRALRPAASLSGP